jgi:HEPN domain-containing protein
MMVPRVSPWLRTLEVYAPWSAVAFHGQQAAEKYLKAILIQRMIHPPHTHKLDELVTAARAAGYALPDLTAECEALINYAVDVRYPEAVPIPAETEGRVLLAAARRILDAVVPLARGS